MTDTPQSSRQAASIRPFGRTHSPAVGALAELYQSETRLLTDLTRVLRRQQEALGANDLEAVDDTVFATYRILGTLGEARKRRRSLHVMLAGVEELDSEAIDSLLGGDPPAALVDARISLRAAALALSDQVRESRVLLENAVAHGEALIRSVYEGTEPGAEQNPFDGGKSGQHGLLLNRTA